jgi:hypothetical protein
LKEETEKCSDKESFSVLLLGHQTYSFGSSDKCVVFIMQR